MFKLTVVNRFKIEILIKLVYIKKKENKKKVVLRNILNCEYDFQF